MLPVLKILTPKVIKGIMDYVFKENNLDMQMNAVLERMIKQQEKIECLEDEIHNLNKKVKS